MKNPNQERIYRLMRQYHRQNQWRLENGLYIPHVYLDPIKELSWWDDVGFILNGRRIMVWWIHPRMKYADTIEDMAWKAAGEPPLRGGDIFEPSIKNWKKVGRSRKKVISYQARSLPDTQRDYYAKLRAIEERMKSDGIDFDVSPSASVEALSWCRGVSLCIPVEVRNKAEINALAKMAKRLVKGETSVEDEFPGYQYGQENWLSEAESRNRIRQ